MTFAIPPDNRAPGTGNPSADEDQLSDMEGLVAALLAQLAGFPGNNMIPADNAANVTALQSILGNYTGVGLAPSGGNDAANVQALINLGIENIYLQAGTFTGTTTVTSSTPPTYVYGAGRWATIWNYTGTGDAFRLYTTTNYSGSGGGPAGGGIKGMTIDGSGAGAGSSGIHAGDIYNLDWDCGARGFQGSGSKGFWFDNQYATNGAEQMHGRIWAENNTTNVVFDNSAGVVSGSFDRTCLDIFLDCKSAGNGVTLQNGVYIKNGALSIRGNINSNSVAQYAVLTITGQNAGAYSRIYNSVLNIGVELFNTGTYVPVTIAFGSAGNNVIYDCTGILDFTGTVTMTHATGYPKSIRFDGPIYGDTVLAAAGASGPLGLYASHQGAISNGSKILTKFASATEVTTTSNVTGVLLDGFVQDDWRVFHVMNYGTGSITFDVAANSTVASGTSCVIQPNSGCSFIWNNDISLWFPVSSSGNFGGLFGDGSDSSATLDGTATVSWAGKSSSVYTMSRDCYCTNLTVNTGVTLITNGWRIFCQGTLSGAGTISCNAGNASGATGGTAPVTSTSCALAGNFGATGVTGVGAQGAFAGMYGATGGVGAGGSGTAGAGGGARNPRSGFAVGMYRTPGALLSCVYGFANTQLQIGGSPGGSAGAGDSTNSGGGGGGGGGVIGIFAWAVTGTLALAANGGNGGTAPTGNCGGGSAGGGGLIVAYTLAAWAVGSTSVTAGSAGSGAGSGTAGSASSAGNVLNVTVT